jgi:hypothetical protein
MKTSASSIMILSTFIFTLMFTHCNRNENEAHPNIILILTDDHRFDALGFTGHPFLKTPNLDRLAREGVYLKNAVVTTSLNETAFGGNPSATFPVSLFTLKFNYNEKKLYVSV